MLQSLRLRGAKVRLVMARASRRDIPSFSVDLEKGP